jgi:hypothetical protein
MVQDSRSASYPGAAIASSCDFGSIYSPDCTVVLSQANSGNLRLTLPTSKFRFDASHLRQMSIKIEAVFLPGAGSLLTVQYETQPDSPKVRTQDTHTEAEGSFLDHSDHRVIVFELYMKGRLHKTTK